MSYMDHNAAFAPSCAIIELSDEEVGAVVGGESPNWAVNGRGPDLSPPPSAQDVERGANTVSALASGFALRGGAAGRAAGIVAVAAQGVAAVAAWVQGNEKPGKPDNGKVQQK
jgi:hypothetical protein